MRIFGLFEGDRVPLDLPKDVTVKVIKEQIWKTLNIPEESGKQDKKVMVLTYGGSNLDDSWIFSDLGIRPGVTIKISLQEEVKPVLFIRCVYNDNVIKMYNNPQVAHMTVSDLKTFVTKKTGIPVGVYRLVTKDGREMFDNFELENYDVDVAHTIHMETWDGWNDFLKLAVMGYTGNVMAQLFPEDAVARYQMKVALFLAAHFGHIDLAVNLLRNGIRPHEPVGDHPTRQWCAENSHVDSLKTPVHEATEQGHIGIVRIFVNNDIRSVLVRDGRGLSPMSVALRNQNIDIVQLLVTKQWTKFPIRKNQHLTLSVYCTTKDWCERAKERVFLLQGPSKSSIKKRSPKGALVSNGVIVDGFSDSQMKARPRIPAKDDSRWRHWDEWKTGTDDPEIYFKRIHMYDRTIVALKTKRSTKWGKMMDKALVNVNPYSNTLDANSIESPITPSSDNSREDVVDANRLKLPSIFEKKPQSLSFQLGSARLSSVGSIAETVTPEPSQRSETKNKLSTGPQNSSKSNVKEASLSVPIPKHGGDVSPLLSKKRLGSRSSIVSQTGDSSEKSSRSEFRRRRQSRPISAALLLSNSKASNGKIPLPILNYDDTAHPKFYYSSTEGDIVTSTLGLYEKYRGMKSRDYAIKCMTIADSFKEMPWLERIKIALNLTSNTVKKRYWDPSSKRRKHSKRPLALSSRF